MSDYSDFCESYGGSANDPDFMGKWLDKYASESTSVGRYISKSEEQAFIIEYGLTDKAWGQVKEYVAIFKDQSLEKHHEVNSRP